METSKTKFKTIEEYHAAFSPEIQEKLDEIKAIIRQAAPAAEEVISYNMPAFKQHGVLVYYAANKEHLGFYPTGTPIAAFKDELAKYTTSKGAIQFPYSKAIPAALVKKIVKFKIKENEEKMRMKGKK